MLLLTDLDKCMKSSSDRLNPDRSKCSRYLVDERMFASVAATNGLIVLKLISKHCNGTLLFLNTDLDIISIPFSDKSQELISSAVLEVLEAMTSQILDNKQQTMSNDKEQCIISDKQQAIQGEQQTMSNA